MRKISLLILLCLVFGIISVFAEEGYDTMADFNPRYEALVNDSDLINLFKEFMEKSDNIDVIREVQSRWEEIDPEGVKAYCEKKLESNPTSPELLYLCGRVEDDPVKQIQIGRRVIELDPKFTYGYRLVTATYMNNLFNNPEESPERAQLQRMLPDDKNLFYKLVDIDPEGTYSMQFLYSLQLYEGDYKAALGTLDMAAKLKARWANQFKYAELYAHMGEYDKALEAVEAEIDRRISMGWPKDEREDNVQYYYRSALTDAGAYEAAIDYIKKTEGYEEDDEKLYDIACLYARSGENAEAMNYLTKAAQKGWYNVNLTDEDTDLESLHSNPEWNSVIATIQKNWDSSAEERKHEALSSKVSKSAPDFELTDADGNTVKLSDLRGKVVVLDFWATWCNPCRMAMPLIDEFVDKDKAADVQVYSINVWEKGRAKARKFMKDHNYDMILLFGNNDLTDAYDVQGIPTLCVIDKEGKIRYIESGYSEGLKDNLIWWTQDLL